MEEISPRAIVLTLEGIKGNQRAYVDWLLGRCVSPRAKLTDIMTEEALAMLADRLITPLQINHYLALAVEEAYRIGQKPVTQEVVESIMAKDIDGLEARLARNGYQVRALAELLNVRQADIRSLFHGRLEPARAQELKEGMMAAGILV